MEGREMEGTQLGGGVEMLPAGPSNTDSPTLTTEEKEEVLDLDGSCGTDGGPPAGGCCAGLGCAGFGTLTANLRP